MQFAVVWLVIKIDHMVDFDLVIQPVIILLLSLQVMALALFLFVGVEWAHTSHRRRKCSDLLGVALADRFEGARTIVWWDVITLGLFLNTFIILVFLFYRMIGHTSGAAMELIVPKQTFFQPAICQD